MDDKRKADQAIPLLGLAAIIATSLGYYLWLEPLRTFRPVIGEPPRPPLERNLPARLWQDPITEARRSYANHSGTEPAQGETGAIRLDPNRDRVLIVQTYGGYSQLDYETRLRTRYAVGLALERASFVPEWPDPEFLRFHVINLAMDPERKDLKTAKVIPYEVWNPAPGRGNDCQTEIMPRVIVLWVGDDIWVDSPLETLENVIREMFAGKPVRRPVPVVGPTSSGGLHSLAEELEREESVDSSAGGRFVFYSPWATADAAFLLSRPGSRLPGSIHRTIADDREVAGYLLSELELRHVDLSSQGADEIAILSEWDTEYGRSLPVTFAACLQLKEQGKNCQDLSEAERATLFRERALQLRKDEKHWPKGLRWVIYLRGLDGIGPRTGPADTKAAEKKGTEPSTQDLERPDGSSQLDYARRMADELARPGGRRLRAVGVLGSDIYDKLLVLQALSERLPDVLFFTTDLDASYLHRSQSNWTRNLLVGSSYSLQSGGDRAGVKSSPPFRDVYGPSIFRATLRAVSPLSCQAQANLDQMETNRTLPAVYEIGRTEAHLLSHQRKGAAELLKPLWRSWIWWLLLLLLVLPALHMLMTGGPALRLLILTAGVGLAFQAIYLLLGQHEPFHWIEGISIWPSEICRTAAAGLAVAFLYKARLGLAKNRAFLCADFNYPVERGWPRPLSRQWWRRLWFLLTKQWKERLDLRPIWDLYDEHDRPSFRYFRSGLLASVSVLLVWWARLREDAPRPCRGTSCVADDIISFGSVAAQFLLLYMVVDVTLACSRWIVALRDTRSRTEQDGARGYPGAWFEIELIARRTQEVSRLVLYPFMTMPLLILAQFSFFDRWNWSISLLAIYASLLVLALAAALILRRCAESARWRAAEEVRAMRVAALEAGDSDRAARMESALREIEAEARGAFSPLSQNPVLAAALLPLSGAGTGLALDSILKTF